ncbi:MFS transporter, partial [Coprinopsis marcescibilis]
YELKPLPKAVHRTQATIFSKSNDDKHGTATQYVSDSSHLDLPEGRVPAHTGMQGRHKRNSMIQFAALCWMVFLIGWNDGTTGPLLPRMQQEYQLGYLIVSMIFVANSIGFITGAIANILLTDRLGLGKIMVLGSCVQFVGYVVMCAAPPFPVIACSYGLTGFGISLQNAQANGLLGSLKEHMSVKLGIFHCLYGLGAFVSPFVSTHFSGIYIWSFHYLISSGLQLSNLLFLILVFRFRKQDDILADAGQEATNEATDGARLGDHSTFASMFKLPAVHLLAAFAVIYVGAEVTLGGWIVTFIIRERGGGPNSGYISSGFFGGLALGRVALLWLNKLVGEERIMYLYSALAIALELTVWFVPSIIENAIAVSVIGMLLGPMFPIIISHSSRILPRWMLTACIGWIAGVGVSGSAVLPFVTGVLASRFGIRSLQPLMVSIMGTMLVLWVCVPKVVRRVD